MKKSDPAGLQHSGTATSISPETQSRDARTNKKQTSGTTDESTDKARIEGPIPEFDTYGTYTGADYVRCTGCGVEAMRRRDLRDGGCTHTGGWS